MSRFMSINDPDDEYGDMTCTNCGENVEPGKWFYDKQDCIYVCATCANTSVTEEVNRG